jgi:predicted DCC family thiol-disulfide oxidoreductase YuxK
MSSTSRTPPLVLFDGECNLCHGAVRWILARDRRERFRFASLNSALARRVLDEAGAASGAPDSVVVIVDRVVRTRSDAALAIARELGPPWSIATCLRFLPRGLRDALYDFVARRRYRWFGRRSACGLLDPALRHRFLDADEPRV